MGTSTRPKDWKMVEEGGMEMKKYHPSSADNSYREFTLLQRNTDDVIEGLPPIHLTYNHLKTFRYNSKSNQRCYVEIQNWLNAAYKCMKPESDEAQLLHALEETSHSMNVPIHELVCQMLKESVDEESK